MIVHGRFASKDLFRQAVVRLGLPASDEEVDALWNMVGNLHEQVDSLRPFLQETLEEGALVDRLFGRGEQG